MFVQFTVGNFLSFRDEAVLSMLAAKIRSRDKSLDNRTTFNAFPDIKLLVMTPTY